MPLQELHRRVAAIVLAAISRHGFALAGGNALIAHGLTSRLTQDVDLFTDQDGAVEATVGDVEASLTAEGFQVEYRDKMDGLAGIEGWDDLGQGLAEWIVTAPDGTQLVLQTSYFDRWCVPHVMVDIGPVIALPDAVGGKVAALVGRAEARDYLDVAAARSRYSVHELISFAIRLDPGLNSEDFTDAGFRLDATPDEVFAYEGAVPETISWIRGQFADWPRSYAEFKALTTSAV